MENIRVGVHFRDGRWFGRWNSWTAESVRITRTTLEDQEAFQIRVDGSGIVDIASLRLTRELAEAIALGVLDMIGHPERTRLDVSVERIAESE